MTVIGIRFKENGKLYYFDPNGISFAVGDSAVVATARGVELGAVAMGNRDVPEREIIAPLKKVIRKATDGDLKRAEDNRRREKEAFGICEKKILAHGLDMKLVEVEFAFDGSKIVFYFTSDGRVDFRELVKDLAASFRTRIELRQIGVRDEAKLVGGLGICGRPFCCKEFMKDFMPVSIKMAKEQGLSLNPTKISGTCGRLMCCLNHEEAAYEDLSRNAPRLGSLVETADGRGIVVAQNLLHERVSVKLDDAESASEYPNSEIKVLRSGKPHGDSPKPDAESAETAENAE